jgi:PncC family amidohydrolase
MELLDISEKILTKHGAVSQEVAKAMSERVRKKSKVKIGVSTTGIAGPSGGTKEKPVGLVYISISNEKKTFVKKFNFLGNRLENKENTCKAAMNMILDVLTDKGDNTC